MHYRLFLHPEAVEWYTPVLEKYRTARQEGWDRIMCRENDLSMRTPIENEDESLYYALHDLNNDGIKELIISEYPYRADTDTSFIDIFTRVDGEVKMPCLCLNWWECGPSAKADL